MTEFVGFHYCEVICSTEIFTVLFLFELILKSDILYNYVIDISLLNKEHKNESQLIRT